MIAPLLEALREKDPATCEIYEQEAGCFQFDDQRRGWILQGGLQEACQARGWGLHQMLFNANRQRPYAMISDGERAPIYAEGDSPAEALLAAYLEAIG